MPERRSKHLPAVLAAAAAILAAVQNLSAALATIGPNRFAASFAPSDQPMNSPAISVHMRSSFPQ